MPDKMIIRLLWILMILMRSSATGAGSGLQIVQTPRGTNQVNGIININDIPPDLLNTNIFSYFSTEDRNIMLSPQYDQIKSILKISNKSRRLELLKEAIEDIDPSFEDNYLLRYAAAKGMKDVVELLLTYPSVDPRAKHGWAFILSKENKHEATYNLLMERSIQNDISPALPVYSADILYDIIYADANGTWDKIREQNDMQLLLETSTKISPHLIYAIYESIYSGKTELAKLMLSFAAFDNSHFNHKVLMKQLMCGYSVRDIRKVDPFLYRADRPSMLVSAMEKQNLELVNFILDNGIKWNHSKVFACSKSYKTRRNGMSHALKIARNLQETNSRNDPELNSIINRLKNLL
jgi:hypothetical protein